MLSAPIPPKTSSHKFEPCPKELKNLEKAQNMKLRELGIDPYEFDSDYTEAEQEILNEALLLITLNQDIPQTLEEKVKEITQNHN